MKLDQLLSTPDPAAAQPLERVRAAVLAELKVPPPRTWGWDVLFVVSECWAICVAVAVVMFTLGAIEPAHLLDRALPIVSLMMIGGCCAFAALAPRRTWLRASGFVLGLVGLVGLVLVRRSSGVGTAPEWVCTVSHLAVGAAPLAFALSMLRKSAIDPLRAALLGLAVGTTGAVVGELACERSWTHVAIWHLGAWVGLAIVAALVSRQLRPRSFAP